MPDRCRLHVVMAFTRWLFLHCSQKQTSGCTLTPQHARGCQVVCKTKYLCGRFHVICRPSLIGAAAGRPPTGNIGPTLAQSWAYVFDGGPALSQRWARISRVQLTSGLPAVHPVLLPWLIYQPTCPLPALDVVHPCTLPLPVK